MDKSLLGNALTSCWLFLGSANENAKNKCSLRFQVCAGRVPILISIERIYNLVFTVQVLIQYIRRHIQRCSEDMVHIFSRQLPACFEIQFPSSLYIQCEENYGFAFWDLFQTSLPPHHSTVLQSTYCLWEFFITSFSPCASSLSVPHQLCNINS